MRRVTACLCPLMALLLAFAISRPTEAWAIKAQTIQVKKPKKTSFGQWFTGGWLKLGKHPINSDWKLSGATTAGVTGAIDAALGEDPVHIIGHSIFNGVIAMLFTPIWNRMVKWHEKLAVKHGWVDDNYKRELERGNELHFSKANALSSNQGNEFRFTQGR